MQMCSGAQLNQLMVRTEEYCVHLIFRLCAVRTGNCSPSRILYTFGKIASRQCRRIVVPVDARVMCLPIEVGVRLIAICDHADTDSASREVDEG